MELAGRTDGALAVSKPEPQEGVATSTPELFLVQDEPAANQPETGLEKPPEKFYLLGIDRVGGLTILKGIVNGQPRAIITHIPPELLLPAEEGRPDTAFEKIRAGALGKLAAVLALAGAGLGIASMSGCASPDDDNRGKVGSQISALSAADVDTLGEPVAAAWTEAGDNRPQISEMDGNKVVTFIRGGDVCYVDCAELEDCLTVETPETVDGLLDISYTTAAIYQTSGGGVKIIFKPAGDVVYEMDIDYVDGVLIASGDPTLPPGSEMGSSFSYMKVDGEPHLLWYGGGAALRNLNTGEDSLPGLSGSYMGICGTPHQDEGGVAIGSFLYDPTVGGSVDSYCRLHSAPTLAGLAEVLGSDFIASQNIDGTNLTNPRSFGNILIYVRNDADGNRIYYAIAPIVPPADGGGEPTPDSGPDPTPDSDSGTGDASPGGSDGPGAPADDAGTDGPTPDPDAGEGEGEDDAGTDIDGSPTPEDGPTTPREDGGPEPKPDANQDIPPNPDECVLDPGTVRITEGSCLFDQCEDQFAQVSGQCTFEVDLGRENPVIIEIDGTYSMDLLERLGGLLRGSYRVVDDGNEMGTVYGDFGAGVSGTTYGGEEQAAENRYRVFCEEGSIVITFRGQEIARLSGGEELTFDTQTGEVITAENPDQPGCSCAAAGSIPNSTPQSLVLGSLLLGLAALFRRSRKKTK